VYADAVLYPAGWGRPAILVTRGYDAAAAPSGRIRRRPVRAAVPAINIAVPLNDSRPPNISDRRALLDGRAHDPPFIATVRLTGHEPATNNTEPFS